MSKTTFDSIVRVDRSVRPEYPDYMKEIKRLDLECTGPAEFDLVNLKGWPLHDELEYGVTWKYVYDSLDQNGMLECYLSLQDGFAIKQKGIKVFHQIFVIKKVLLWRSVVECDDGDLHVPYLCGDGGRVTVRWRCLVGIYHDDKFYHHAFRPIG